MKFIFLCEPARERRNKTSELLSEASADVSLGACCKIGNERSEIEESEGAGPSESEECDELECELDDASESRAYAADDEDTVCIEPCRWPRSRAVPLDDGCCCCCGRWWPRNKSDLCWMSFKELTISSLLRSGTLKT